MDETERRKLRQRLEASAELARRGATAGERQAAAEAVKRIAARLGEPAPQCDTHVTPSPSERPARPAPCYHFDRCVMRATRCAGCPLIGMPDMAPPPSERRWTPPPGWQAPQRPRPAPPRPGRIFVFGHRPGVTDDLLRQVAAEYGVSPDDVIDAEML